MYYVLLAEGFEEIEALTQTDVLRRAGIDVMDVGLSGEFVSGAHGISVKCDITIDEAVKKNDSEGVILPGGMPGTLNIAACSSALTLIKKTYDEGKLVAAICAAPSVLGSMGILKGKKCTCYPGFEDRLAGGIIVSDKVVIDKNVITSKGPGTALDFALAICRYITSKDMSELSEKMIYKG